MKTMSDALSYMWMAWGTITAALTILVVYGNTLSMREDDQLYLNAEEQVMMAAEQRLLINKMHGLGHVVVGLAVLSGLLFAACVSTWVWIGLSR